MRKSLIIILIFTLFLEGIGGFLDSRSLACNLATSSYSGFSSVFTGLPSRDHEKQENEQPGESQEILEMPTEDDYCHCSMTDLKVGPVYDQERQNHYDFYISHYPSASKEIHTPPPRA